MMPIIDLSRVALYPLLSPATRKTLGFLRSRRISAMPTRTGPGTLIHRPPPSLPACLGDCSASPIESGTTTQQQQRVLRIVQERRKGFASNTVFGHRLRIPSSDTILVPLMCRVSRRWTSQASQTPYRNKQKRIESNRGP